MIEDAWQYREAKCAIRRKRYAIKRVDDASGTVAVRFPLCPDWARRALLERWLQLKYDIERLKVERKEWRKKNGGKGGV